MLPQFVGGASQHTLRFKFSPLLLSAVVVIHDPPSHGMTRNPKSKTWKMSEIRKPYSTRMNSSVSGFLEARAIGA